MYIVWLHNQGWGYATRLICKKEAALARQFYKRLGDILTVIGYSQLAADWAVP